MEDAAEHHDTGAEGGQAGDDAAAAATAAAIALPVIGVGAVSSGTGEGCQ